MSTLHGSFYSPARGGHAPGDLRDAFAEAVDAFAAWRDGDAEPRVEVRERPVPISALCGLLWNCRDALPSLLRTALEDAGFERCGSYASAARQMKAAIVQLTQRAAA